MVLPVAVAIVLLAGCGAPAFPSNWAGYCATGGSFTSVSARWVQPTVIPSGASGAASFWVGFDGRQNHYVEQIGTEAETTDQTASYSAWYEMYPAPAVDVNMAIHPGDQMNATVSRDGPGRFTLTIINETTGASFATTQAANKAPTSSAEVVAEAPTSGFAEFDTVRFAGCAIDGRPLDASGPTRLDIVGHTAQVEATASGLGGGGTSFNVTQPPTVAWRDRADRTVRRDNDFLYLVHLRGFVAVK